MEKQLKKGILELCVLSIINKQDIYGYKIVSKISQYFQINEKSVYPILYRLTKDELISSYVGHSNEGPPRKYYSITENGKFDLNEKQSKFYSFITNVTKLLEEQKWKMIT